MSVVPMSRIQEYARKMGVVIRQHSPTTKTLDSLVKHIKETDMCGGYIITQGPDRIQRRDGYDLKDTHLYIAHRADDDQIIGFIMYADKFLKTHHNSVNIDHPNFKDKTKKISVILDICAAPERNSARRAREQKNNLQPVNGIKGVGSLLMLLALSKCGENGAVLFVSQLPKKLHISEGKKKKKSTYDIWYSTPSGMAFYDKMDFKVVKGYDSKGELLGGAQIRYRDHRTTLQEADSVMRKYTATDPSKQPRKVSRPKSPPRARSPSNVPKFSRFNVVDSPASSVSSGRVRSPTSPGGVQVRKKSVSGRRSSPSAVLEYLKEMKQAQQSNSRSRSRSRSRSPSPQPSAGRGLSPSRSRSRSRSPSPSQSARSSSSRRRGRSENKSPNARRRKPATGVYCGDKPRGPNGRRRGTPRQCFSKGVGVGYNLGRHGGSPVRQFGSRGRKSSRSRRRSRSHVHMKGRYYKL